MTTSEAVSARSAGAYQVRPPYAPAAAGVQAPPPYVPASAARTGAPEAQQTAPLVPAGSSAPTGTAKAPASSGAAEPSAPSAPSAPPERPSLRDKEAAPVLVKVAPPFFVRASQVFWVTSLLVGAAAVVYLFIIRLSQLPVIADRVRAVDAARAEATYTSAADIIFWSVFGLLVTILLLQIVFHVSFSNRRPRARWWQFGTVLFQAGLVLMAREFVTLGERGIALERLLLLQLALAVVGLLLSVSPQALRWTARQHDIRRGPIAPAGDSAL